MEDYSKTFISLGALSLCLYGQTMITNGYISQEEQNALAYHTARIAVIFLGHSAYIFGRSLFSSQKSFPAESSDEGKNHPIKSNTASDEVPAGIAGFPVIKLLTRCIIPATLFATCVQIGRLDHPYRNPYLGREFLAYL